MCQVRPCCSFNASWFSSSRCTEPNHGSDDQEVKSEDVPVESQKVPSVAEAQDVLAALSSQAPEPADGTSSTQESVDTTADEKISEGGTLENETQKQPGEKEQDSNQTSDNQAPKTNPGNPSIESAAAKPEANVKVKRENEADKSQVIGLLGNGRFEPQAAPAPSLDQYTQRAKDANSKVQRNKYDIEAWKVLVSEVQSGAMKHLFVEIYERLLEVFPTSGRHWLAYANQYVAENDKKKAIEVLKRGLPHCPHVDLWRSYLTHFTSVTMQSTKDNSEVLKAFERAVDAVGQDISSNSLWSEYIAFLRSCKVSNQYENTQRMNQLRRAYHRCLQVPMHSVDKLWTEYEQWEKTLDPNNLQMAEQIIRDLEPKHKAARVAYKERKKLRDAVQNPQFPGPYTGENKEKQNLKAWQELISFERSNPQKMPSEDLRKRVAFTFNQCLSYLPLYPEIWYEAGNWHGEIGDLSGEIKTLEKGISMIPNSLLLHFALAEKHEMRGNITEAKNVYENLCELQPSPLVFIHYMRFARRSESVQSARTIFKKARKSAQGCSWHVYCDAALREYYSNKDAQVARNIFEMGLKHYSCEVEFVLQYLDFLASFNDDNNTRVVFEKVLADENSLDRQQALLIWDRFVDFEYSRGDLSAIHKLEQRRAMIYPERQGSQSLAQLACRFRFSNLWPCSNIERDLLGIQSQDSATLSSQKSKGSGSSGKGDPDSHAKEKGGSSDKPSKSSSMDHKRPSVPLPPIPLAVQELLNQLPSGPFPVSPNPDEILSLIHQLIVPPQFYKPPQTMSVAPGK